MNEFIEYCNFIKKLELMKVYEIVQKMLLESGMTMLNGHSDGGIYFNGKNNGKFRGIAESRTFEFEDDTKVSIKYTKSGFWRIKVLKVGSAEQHLIKGTDDAADYSDMFFIRSKKKGVQDE